MNDYLNIAAFLEPVVIDELIGDDLFKQDQLGSVIEKFEESFPDLDHIDIVLIGCNEKRGSGIIGKELNNANAIRKEIYQLFYWHQDIKIADIGNIKKGKSYSDTIAALQMVIAELLNENKTVIILGGSHDITTAQYNAYVQQQKLIHATVVDAVIDLDMESPYAKDNFLMPMLTGEPNFVQHYNHIAFQSYLVHPGMLVTLDKLKFDFYRVGHVKEDLDEMEPVLRNTHLMSFDINAIAYAFAPTNRTTPNGLTGEEACTLMQYAGLSTHLSTLGLYGYNQENDEHNITAKQISQMFWYFLDGRYKRLREASLDQQSEFNVFELMFSEVSTQFLQSKKTGRWWMRLSNNQYIPCSYNDYLKAGRNEIPERWFRAQQR
ncbi:MAG: arginase [Chitinophagaceae bacterium]|nr:MAG: arginase [Chitinophagaceae bacterium]